MCAVVDNYDTQFFSLIFSHHSCMHHQCVKRSHFLQLSNINNNKRGTIRDAWCGEMYIQIDEPDAKERRNH